MARPTKPRRSTKHRGNAAGMIEARGRTGRPPTAAEKGRGGAKGGKGGKGGPKRNRYDKPPTWRSAATRGAVAAVVVFAISFTLLKKQSIAAEGVLLPIVFALYTPMIYYTDLMLFRRAERRKAEGK
jgi:hypothetical protein